MKNLFAPKILIWALAAAVACPFPAAATLDCQKVTANSVQPEPILPPFRTQRTIVRPLQNQDIEAAVAILTHPKSLEMSGDVLDPNELRGNLSGLLHLQPDSRWKQRIVFAIVSKDTNHVIGVFRFSGLFAVKNSPLRKQPEWREKFDEVYPYATIGYAIDPGFWGRGLMTEVLSEAIPYATKNLGIYQVSAYVKDSNRPSQAVLVSNGFSVEDQSDSMSLYSRILRNLNL